MRYKYKVRELGKEIVQDMEAMSLKKLRRKLDHKKEYAMSIQTNIIILFQLQLEV